MKKSNKNIALRVCGKLNQKFSLDTGFKDVAPENFCEVNIGGMFFTVSWTEDQVNLSVMNDKYKILVDKKFKIKKKEPSYDVSAFQISDLAEHMDGKKQADSFKSSFNAVVINPKSKKKK
jgi:hypothetical protein